MSRKDKNTGNVKRCCYVRRSYDYFPYIPMFVNALDEMFCNKNDDCEKFPCCERKGELWKPIIKYNDEEVNKIQYHYYSFINIEKYNLNGYIKSINKEGNFELTNNIEEAINFDNEEELEDLLENISNEDIKKQEIEIGIITIKKSREFTHRKKFYKKYKVNNT